MKWFIKRKRKVWDKQRGLNMSVMVMLKRATCGAIYGRGMEGELMRGEAEKREEYNKRNVSCKRRNGRKKDGRGK